MYTHIILHCIVCACMCMYVCTYVSHPYAIQHCTYLCPMQTYIDNTCVYPVQYSECVYSVQYSMCVPCTMQYSMCVLCIIQYHMCVLCTVQYVCTLYNTVNVCTLYSTVCVYPVQYSAYTGSVLVLTVKDECSCRINFPSSTALPEAD